MNSIYRLISVPCTGQTPIFASQLQGWAMQHWAEKGIECYCLDAPEYVPSGVVIGSRWNASKVGQAGFIPRD